MNQSGTNNENKCIIKPIETKSMDNTKLKSFDDLFEPIYNTCSFANEVEELNHIGLCSVATSSENKNKEKTSPPQLPSLPSLDIKFIDLVKSS